MTEMTSITLQPGRGDMMPFSSWSPFHAPLPPPTQDIRRLLKRLPDGSPGFETFEMADQERRHRVAALHKSGVLGASAVADRIASCAQGYRCLSPSCPVCLGRLRIWFYPLVVEALKAMQQTSQSNTVFLTLVNESWIVPKSKIIYFTPKRLFDCVRQQFRRAGAKNVVIIGALHGEYDGKHQYWQPHLHLVAAGLTWETVNLMRQRHYQRSGYVYRPMLMQPLNSPERQISYLLKSYWPMKVRFVGVDGQHKSKFQRIPEPFHSAYLVMLNQLKLLDLVFLLGVRRYGDSLRPVLL